ncbi:MAG TPA: class I SAM-dependent methyltransferase [Actinopolymorphaceae bacterium]
MQTTDVPLAFDEGAATYDVMVRRNPGYHRHLRSASRALVGRLPRRGTDADPLRLVDLGAGSGVSTVAMIRALDADRQPAGITGIDASAQMLAQATAKRWPAGVRFVHGRAEKLAGDRAAWGIAEPLDGVFAAYLFRNLDPAESRDEALQAVRDLLAPGGALVVQEYSTAGNRPAAMVWTAVCWTVVIPLGWLTSRQTRLYRYLWRSVRTFDSVDVFTARLHRAGFVDVEVDTVGGWQRGILHTFRASAPPRAELRDTA